MLERQNRTNSIESTEILLTTGLPLPAVSLKALRRAAALRRRIDKLKLELAKTLGLPNV